MEKLFVITDYMVRKHLSDYRRVMITVPKDVYYKFCNVTVSELASEQGYKSFDVALPIDMVRDIQKRTGQSVTGHCVMSYDNNTFGEIVGITDKGKLCMSIYNHIMENKR